MDALRRRESQLALRDFEDGQTDDYDKNYEQELELNKQRDLNLLLAKYFDRESNRDYSSPHYNVMPENAEPNEFYENDRRQQPIFRGETEGNEKHMTAVMRIQSVNQ